MCKYMHDYKIYIFNPLNTKLINNKIFFSRLATEMYFVN